MDTRLLGLTLALLASLAACAKSRGGQTGDEGALPSDERFFGELVRRGDSGDYTPAGSVAALVAESDRVVVGRAVALRAGRTYVERGGAARAHTAVLELEVERTLKGAQRPALYLEFVVGAEDVAPPERLPESRVVAFAVENGAGWDGDGTIENEGRGLPAGETLYRLTNPDALAIASADGRSVLSIQPGTTVFGGGDLDDVIAMVESALAGDAGVADAGMSVGGDDGGAGPRDAAVAVCPGEYPTGPGADPVACPSECYAVQGSPFDAANGCVDYENMEALGCIDGAAPPVVACVERIADGQAFMVPSAWPFPSSPNYRACSDELSSAVLSASACM